jgi:peptidoglycan/LPS O-acetylase OafA/YrhL/lysophospholipase L1-like esterase
VPAQQSTDSRAEYLPALDGIRAIAVGAVVAYHLHVPFFDGGLLGVSVFFTLSGYLITSLLIRGFERQGRVELKAFWLRRARRLLPALLLMLPVVAVTAAISRPDKLLTTVKQVVYALLYVANWTTIARGDDYFQRFSGPGPLDHLWSLAIEEQFYIVWPLLVFALLWVSRRSSAPALRRGLLAFVTLLLAGASTWAIVHLYDPHAMNNTRAYEGTDARAAALLVGALAAMALPFDRVPSVSRRSRIALDVVGMLGLAGVIACIARTDEYSPFLYRGGELVLATSTAVLALAASHPGTLVARALGVLPLRWLGARSYGVYLWHLPVVAFMPSTVLIERPVLRGAVQLGLILMLAAASFRLIEDPIRRRASAPRPVRARSLAFRTVVLLPVATIALVVWPLSCRPPIELEALASEPEPTSPGAVIVASASASMVALPPVVDTEPKVPGAPSTSCREVVHVGDSTSLGLVSTRLLPNVDDQIAARYRAVGVERFSPDISGARSMVETYRDQPNATEIVKRRHASGYSGCYVLALGTNDPANTSGNVALLGTRIDGMMAHIGETPVLWTTTKTLKDKGPYQNANMASWNEALLKACARHANMRVYDWASEVQNDWFTSDGIHYNGAGYKERAARIAKALARAFPKGSSPTTECVVHASN